VLRTLCDGSNENSRDKWGVSDLKTPICVGDEGNAFSQLDENAIVLLRYTAPLSKSLAAQNLNSINISLKLTFDSLSTGLLF
jgi:hypothetical protein